MVPDSPGRHLTGTRCEGPGSLPKSWLGACPRRRERIPHVMSSHRFADWEAAPGWVVQRAGGQHGDEDVEQAVHDATYGASMTMPAGAQTFVVRATDRIMAGGGLAPKGPPPGQPRVACGAPAEPGAPPALSRERCPPR